MRDQVLTALDRTGLLLTQDLKLPNVVTLLTGEQLRTSWWSHPKGKLIFSVLSELDDHPDVLFAKMLHQKVTLIHRRLWPAFLGMVSHQEPWQTDGLSAAARTLLASVNEAKDPIIQSGAAVKELERRLLANTRQIHSDSGSHKLAVESWTAWSRRVGTKPLRSKRAAKEELERAVQSLGADVGALPWNGS